MTRPALPKIRGVKPYAFDSSCSCGKGARADCSQHPYQTPGGVISPRSSSQFAARDPGAAFPFRLLRPWPPGANSRRSHRAPRRLPPKRWRRLRSCPAARRRTGCSTAGPPAGISAYQYVVLGAVSAGRRPAPWAPGAVLLDPRMSCVSASLDTLEPPELVEPAELRSVLSAAQAPRRSASSAADRNRVMASPFKALQDGARSVPARLAADPVPPRLLRAVERVV